MTEEILNLGQGAGIKASDTWKKFCGEITAPAVAVAKTVANLPAPPVIGPGALETAERALTYIYAGNATFTLRSTKTGDRFTYKVTKAEQNARNAKEVWFVKLLSGPENTSDYTYLGVLDRTGFRLTKASKAGADAPSVKAISWTTRKLFEGRMPLGLEIWHEGRCGRCGRKLTVPESIAAGLGPECAGRM